MQHLLFWHHGYNNNMFLPLYSFSAEEIFRGEILLFNVNFFEEQKPIYARIQRTTQTDSVTDNGSQTDHEYGEPQVEKEDILVTGNDDFEKEIVNETTKNPDHTDTSTTMETTTTRTEVQYYYYLNDDGERIMTSKQNTALDLQAVVSQWYSAVRNIAIVLSMSVLLYVGIRMLLSTVAQDKAKYKQMLIDWCVGLCLLFFLHYIMAFSVSMVEAFNQIVSQAGRESINSTILNYGDGEVSEEAQNIAEQYASNDQFVLLQDDENGKITEKLKDLGMEAFIDDSTNPAQIVWPTNLMGVLRLRAQVSYGDASFIGYGLCYTILVLFTLYFVYVYLRRVLYMAFLTMIAPLVALTYPIDKISDGQAQGFNKWLKEYLFNLLIQPLHLLLYTILVTSAIELAATNAIYSLVAIGFLIPAEKLMRSLFGFEKASTPGSAAGAVAGATLLNTGLQKLLHKAPGGGKGSGDKGTGAEGDNATPRFGFKDSESEEVEDDSDNISMIDAGGTSAADAASYNPAENPVQRAEREALEEKLADGQINKNELSAQQRALLGMKAAQEEQDQQGNIGQQTGILTGQQNGTRAQQNANNKKPLTKRQQQRRRIAGVAKLTARQAGRKFKRVAPKAIRTVAKVGAGAALGLTAGAIGATVGIATGDPSNVFSYGGGAAVAGGLLGSGVVNTNTPERIKSANQIAREREFWGEDYEKHAAEERLKEFKRNTEMREKLEKNLGLDRTDELYKSGRFEQYIRNEVTGYENIVALENLQKNEKMKFDDALLIFDAYDKYGDITGQKPKDRTDIEEGYTKKFQKANLNEREARKKASKLSEMTKAFDSYKKNAH